MLCRLCHNKNGYKKTKKFGTICGSCYKTYCLIKLQCNICYEWDYLKSKKNGFKICHKCYRALNPASNKRPLKECCKCHKIAKTAKNIALGSICHKCYEAPKHICSNCRELKIIYSTKNNITLCNRCYFAPKKKCSKCGLYGYIKIKNPNICRKCYSQPKSTCSRCKRSLPVAIWLKKSTPNSKPLCKSCYDVCIYLKIETNRIKGLIRKRLRDAFNKPIGHNQYNIDYVAIIKHLGKCPGNRKSYHIDHIMPLAAFDFDNSTHIQAAFAPENHQWLKKEENLIKSDNYNKEDLKIYLDKVARTL